MIINLALHKKRQRAVFIQPNLHVQTAACTTATAQLMQYSRLQ
uniref:Uncharacterized protein n=1 Tax=Anguilla anguilla TaxID=7936 RepID=A0A0E9XY09_ANGAN